MLITITPDGELTRHDKPAGEVDAAGHGPSRDGDLRELAHDLHVIQDRILAQAAGRAYPDRYRLLGGTVNDSTREDVG